MEDFFSVAYQQTEDEKDLEYAFFGIFDGHGGAEAAAFAKEHLMESIVKHRGFWSDDDEEVLHSIKDGFIHTHYSMWKIHDQWPKTASGLPSTAGTTASVAFIRRGKIYIGHVGDSGITLGYQDPGCPDWKSKPLTKDHKPESEAEMKRIEQSGGKVLSKSGVPRVVWNRPRIGHKGPVRRSTPIDEIPFLAVARSLGDLWSYNSALDEFVVSPTPDVAVIPIDTSTFRCLIFGTDGLYNMLSPQMAVHIVQQAEKHNEQAALSDGPNKIWINPSKCLVEKALDRWCNTKMRADNTSVITLMLDPRGPPRAQVLLNKKNSYSSRGLQIETRYQDANPAIVQEQVAQDVPEPMKKNMSPDKDDLRDVEQTDLSKLSAPIVEEVDKEFVPKPRESIAFNTRPKPPDEDDASTVATGQSSDIQINEVSSSSLDVLPGGRDAAAERAAVRKSGLRSASNRDEITSSRGKKCPPPPCPSSGGAECRVLRERKNTPNDKNPMQKKKFNNIRNKLNIGTSEKRKLLQSVLFKSKDPPVKLRSSSSLMTPSCSESAPKKTKEILTRVLRNNNGTEKKSEGPSSASTASKSSNGPQHTSTPAVASSSRKTAEREVRKSTLAQKLRMHQEIFKAKLRGRPTVAQSRKSTKDKVIRVKKSAKRS